MYGDIVVQPANNNAGYLTLAMSNACVNKQLIVGGSLHPAGFQSDVCFNHLPPGKRT